MGPRAVDRSGCGVGFASATRDADLVQLETLTAEHPTLGGLASSLVSVLENWSGEIRIAEGASNWMHHGQFAERTEHLASHLAAIVLLAEDGRFTSSMAVARTALEHHIIDRLLLLADRYVVNVRPEDPALIDQWEADWETKTEPWTRDVVSIERVQNGRAIRLVRVGHNVSDNSGEEREQISPYWLALEQYDAFLGHPDTQRHIVQPFDELDDRVEWAARNQALYGAFLRWRSLCSNLRLNDLTSEVELVQLQVHYAFLSAFTHATSSGYEVNHRARPGSPSARHLFGELALLYVIAITIAQTDAWTAYAKRRPHLLLTPRPDILRAVDRGREVISYLWFLVGEPQEFDRYQEANRRAHSRLLSGHGPAVRPDELGPADITYYGNPFDRLARMHTGEREATTGFAFAPAWRELHW